MRKIRKIFLILLIFIISVCCLSSCKKSELDKDNPVTLTLWHVYGEQSDSPMNRLIDEFNSTVGMEKGIIINVTAMSNATQIGQKLLDAHNKIPGSAEMPDLFFAHKNNAMAIGTDNLLDWNEYFSEKELSYPNPRTFYLLQAGSLSVFQRIRALHTTLFPIGTAFLMLPRNITTGQAASLSVLLIIFFELLSLRLWKMVPEMFLTITDFMILQTKSLRIHL